jgi:hypothetical protein
MPPETQQLSRTQVCWVSGDPHKLDDLEFPPLNPTCYYLIRRPAGMNANADFGSLQILHCLPAQRKHHRQGRQQRACRREKYADLAGLVFGDQVGGQLLEHVLQFVRALGAQFIIPRGDTVLCAEDVLTMVGEATSILEARKLCGK